MKKLVWKEYKLIVTDPPMYQGHFGLIKKELIPYVKRRCLDFWITNYWNQNEDFILFRVKGNTTQHKRVENLLNKLISKSLINRYIISTWNPRKDAKTRINNLATRIPNFNPKTHRIEAFTNVLTVYPDPNFNERMKQLMTLFESLGECTKILYTNLKSKPEDKWIMSLFIHLLLNSLDYSGPNPPSDEVNIRSIPAF